uniref:Putative ovule protein n=1 Tax=Solanum chacoense TaxID=4108 RepID=A0A0V0GPT7_SOLCH
MKKVLRTSSIFIKHIKSSDSCYLYNPGKNSAEKIWHGGNGSLNLNTLFHLYCLTRHGKGLLLTYAS